MPLGAKDALVEWNEVNGAVIRCSDAACGVWPFACDDTILQYNEVYGCAPSGNGDGEAYDSDYNCDGTIFQYNYSHDNPDGFMRICNSNEEDDYNRNTIVRYNVSVNDGSNLGSIFAVWGISITNCKIYNTR